MEIIITIAIVLLAVFIIFKNIKKSSKGECNCGHCSKSCPARKEKEDASK
ncbi:Virus attachment protein p12 family protein [Clostridium sp. DSM 8431]|nr:FeoB-associated Cys-rich membrane protein [Clostridium sp. DSM 8431]SFU56818.1 Virus attachment protein p12 family protein [Clostridium sp. DSM 8431]